MTTISQLPKPTQVNKVIPKNAFDLYCTSQLKKLFSDTIERIRWTHKLAWETTNLPTHEIKEIQCFDIELRQKEGFEEVLRIIDRAIPYPILYKLMLGDSRKWVISQKHPHPTNEDNSVIEWTFESLWTTNQSDLKVELKESLDTVFRKLCLEVSGELSPDHVAIQELVELKKKSADLESKIQKIKSRIAN